ncbi:MAG: hypothetical protein ACRDI0_08125 [Actinomycetota bacterium]
MAQQPPAGTPPPAGSPADRPQNVTIAAILLFVAGGLSILGGLFLLQVGGVVLVYALLGLALGAAAIYAGVQVMALREQGRLLGLGLAGLGALLNLISLISFFNIFTLLGLLLYGAIIYLLVTTASSFRR